MSIRAVCFDLGGVILRTENKAPRMELARSLGLDYARIEEIVFGSESGRRASVGAISVEEHWRNVTRALSLPANEAARVEQAFFGGDRIDWTLVDFIRSLRPRVKVGLISNAWSGMRPWIVGQKFADAFDEMVISAEVGAAKPDARIYRYALEKLEAHPDEAAFVDDMPENVAGAAALGMHGLVFRDTGSAIVEVKQLLEA